MLYTPATYLNAAALGICAVSVVQASYIPGLLPTNYRTGDSVPVFVNSLAPGVASDAHVKSLLAFDCMPLVALLLTRSLR